ncbi:4-hydroxyphenylpyruvate dioxygenase [Glaciihabitans tibetensis]|uniref:3-dehydroshikimate dehydratase n=1 Tax=Glaciihabitans tibetensis TaxID=1266600 RepID=A0A2T0VG44_9MICO|nr:sugar phosphate isomerase/epimerase and 4-hydroxyphenylpyruvate domain-containing protein [Glaciihabitans tibetensis]PRY69173.1 4-hydroxyphenylpyruvate dioxygenase [Glaciihabitans tibetensis]
MKTSIATVCLSGTLEEKLKASAAAGFDGVEIFEPDFVASSLSPELVASTARDLGLTLDLYQPFRDFEGVGQEKLRQNLRRAAAKFDLMNRLGISTILLCSNVGTAVSADDALAVDQLGRLGDLAESYGVRVAYEALAWGRYVNDYEHAAAIVRAVDHPAIGHCLDSFHILSRGWDPAAIETIPADKIFFVQMADAPGLTMDLLSWSRHHRVFPGEGGFDLADFMGHLLRAGYDGPMSLEIFNDTFRRTDPFRTAVDAMRSLEWLQELACQALERDGREGSRMELSPLPTMVAPVGFNFVEIRADDHRLDQVRTTLHQLGFTDAGNHHSKPVELWSQGGARVIINRGDSTAGSPAVAALGFDVLDPELAAERAGRLLAPPVPRDRGAGDEQLLGVRAPDSSEIFFGRVGRGGVPAWVSEFGGSTEVTTDPLVTRVDHVNLAQSWEYFDAAVLFCTSVLALDPQPSLDVAAPTGLVRSQVMSTADGIVRLVLNLSPTGSADTAQHVAFASTDAIGAARRARERGLAFLPIGENYYEDLDSRFDLKPEFLEEIRELQLMYDRDERGEFLHFYTESLGSVFFEIVERRGGYRGYGATNAPVRLAAQHSRRPIVAAP